MPVRHHDWYNLCETIDFPVDESASCQSDDGVRLPHDIVADLKLRWPRELGRCAFLASVRVTSLLVSITLQAAEDLDTVVAFTPLAVLSIRQPVEKYRQYALLAQAEGVGGWIVFGLGASTGTSYAARFSGPVQSLLAPRAARPYLSLPVSGLRAHDAGQALQDSVLLRALAPLELSKEERDIKGSLRDCIVLRLAEDSSSISTTDPLAASLLGKPKSLFEQFAGPCAGRPESSTCGDPQPIEFINSVAPDCNGLLTIQFESCAHISKLGDSAALIDCGLSLAAACNADQIPSSEGILPGQGQVIPIVPPPPPIIPAAESDSLSTATDLPYTECFNDSSADEFVVKAGLWTLVADDSPSRVCPPGSSDSSAESSSGHPGTSYATNTAATPSFSVWTGDVTTLSRRTVTEVKLLEGPSGAKHNAFVTLNYRPSTTDPSLAVCYLAQLDYDEQAFKISRWTGLGFQDAVSVLVPGIMLDEWYRITTTVHPGSPGEALITARLESVSNPGIDLTIGPLAVSNYLPGDGKSGLGSNRAIVYFSYFHVEENLS